MLKVFVAGHQGMVGSAICRKLEKENISIVTATRSELDLLNYELVKDFFAFNSFDQIYLAAAKVGGIHANNEFPADFIFENLTIQNNIIKSAHENNIDKLLFLGSSCIYPKFASQPIKEEELLNGKLEESNEPYAIAKIAGIKMCESFNRQHGRDYRSVMPTNLYGQNDNFHGANSHVIPALMNKFHQSKINNTPEVVVWGSGKPLREFLHVDDMAEASIFLMNLNKGFYEKETKKMSSHINVGSGIDLTIKELAEMLAEVTGFEGKIVWDKTKLDGTPRKLMDISKLKRLGWKSKISLKDGLETTYEWFKKNYKNLRV